MLLPMNPTAIARLPGGWPACTMLWLACASFSIAPARAQEVLLHNFAGPPPSGENPDGVIRDSEGNLYGTTDSGGAFNQGVLFKIDSSTKLTVLHNFAGEGDGASPAGGLALDPAGNVYGTTSYGGVDNSSTVYKVDPSGQETVLYSGSDIYFPLGVTIGPDGDLYGASYYGGLYGEGCVYKLNTAGQLTVLYSFMAGGVSESNPEGGVTVDTAGNVYGTTINGGASNDGTVYRVDPAGNETVLYSFTGRADGSSPEGSIALDPAGNIYGITEFGGAGYGLVYKLNTSGQLTVLYTFTGGLDGSEPSWGVVRDAAGNLYGTTPYGGANKAGTVYKVDTAGGETVLYNFAIGVVDNDYGPPGPSGVVLGPSGDLYGTTDFGGKEGLGVVFQLAQSGQETVLYSFPGTSDGREPFAGLVRDSGGNLYGTTYLGGIAELGVVFKLAPTGEETLLYIFSVSSGGNPPSGVTRDPAGNLYGTTAGDIFKLDPAGHLTVLHDFTFAGGVGPGSGIALDSAGNLYGTTYSGGASDYGTVYKLDTSGNFTVLHSFGNYDDGGFPVAGVTLDPAGNIYGTATDAGGYVYKLDPSGHETILHYFGGPDDGTYPEAGVVLDAAGNIYGTTEVGGKFNSGTVYKIDTSGAETVLYDFTGRDDGEFPIGGVILDASGNLYGTASVGGKYDLGVVFELTPSGTFQVLHDFAGGTDGADPEDSLLLGPSGSLYGTTVLGAASGGGVVFEIRR